MQRCTRAGIACIPISFYQACRIMRLFVISLSTRTHKNRPTYQRIDSEILNMFSHFKLSREFKLSRVKSRADSLQCVTGAFKATDVRGGKHW